MAANPSDVAAGQPNGPQAPYQRQTELAQLAGQRARTVLPE